MMGPLDPARGPHLHTARPESGGPSFRFFACERTRFQFDPKMPAEHGRERQPPCGKWRRVHELTVGPEDLEASKVRGYQSHVVYPTVRTVRPVGVPMNEISHFQILPKAHVAGI